MSFSSLCFVIGIIYSIVRLIKIVKWFVKYFLPSKVDFKTKYGDGWVLITGGSEGIGFAFAKKFLQLGYKVCLLSRNKDKLSQAESSLKKEFPSGEIKTIAYDLNKNYTNEDIKQLEKEISILKDDISILVNNAGVITRKILCELTDEQVHSMLNVNLMAMTYITKIVINIMMKRKERSLVVGSGSVNGRMRIRTRSIYSSTKSYMESFYEIMNREYGSKIDFTCLEIGAVETALNQVNMPMKVNADTFAESAVNYLGKYGLTTGNIKHELLNILFWKVPFVKEIFYMKGGSMK